MKGEKWRLFHQKEELTTRIHNILQDYPPGIGPFKEFLQNADDAQARVFSLILDETDYSQKTQGSKKKKEEGNQNQNQNQGGLISTNLEEWQGPALLVYDSAVFTDNDFDNITRLGKSEKNEDLTRIGKYGLGFNVAYHYSDVVGFISRDQFILFDPHGRDLPDRMLGLRMNFVTEEMAKQYPRQLQPFLSSTEPYRFDGTNSLNGTIFRLPFRTQAQAEKSQLSKCFYSVSHVLETLKDFAGVAPLMMLFLKHVEEISIYRINKLKGECELISKVTTQNVTPELRIRRNFISEYVSNEVLKKSETVRSTYQMTTTHFVNNETRTQKWLVHSGSHSGLPNLQETIQKIQWAGVAALLENDSGSQVEGKAYCFLPLPISTGLPVHVNAFFALSSNRRDLWKSEDTEGLGAAKAQWNQHLLSAVLPSLYSELLESLKQLQAPNDDLEWYKLWPSLSRSNPPFNLMVQNFYQDIVEKKRKVFWHPSSKKWLDFSQVYFETEKSLQFCGNRLRKVLDRTQFNLIKIPASLVKSFKEVGIQVPSVKPNIVAIHLREVSNKLQLTREEAEEVLKYLLCEYDSESKNAQVFEYICGIRCLPLVGGQLGLVERKYSGEVNLQPETHFYVSSPEYFPIFQNFPFFLDPSCGVYQKLNTTQCFSVTNIAPLSLKTIGQIMNYILPESWVRKKCVAIKSLEELQGNIIDRRQVLPDFHFGEYQQESSSLEETESRWVSSSSGKKGKRKKPVKTEKAAIITEPPKIDISVKDIENRLRLFWSFIDKLSDFNEKEALQFLTDWPIITTQAGYVVSIAYAKERVLLYDQDYSSTELKILTAFGCLYTSIASFRLRHLVGIWKHDTLRALAQSCKDVVAPITDQNCQDLQKMVLNWEDKKEFGLFGKHLSHLPIFKTLGGKFVSLWSQVVGSPPSNGDCFQSVSNWDILLGPNFADRLLSYGTPSLLELLKLANCPRMSEIEFLHRILLKHINEESEEICLAFLKSVSEQKPWKSKSPTHLEFVTELSEMNIVICPDGSRFKCSHFLDPSDAVLTQILHSAKSNSSKNLSSLYPPPKYQEPAILLAMRHLGMLNLKNQDGFIKAAQYVAQEGLVENALLLIHTLLTSSDYTLWDQIFFDRIMALPIFPLFNFRNLALPPKDCWITPKYLPSQKNKSSSEPKKSKISHRSGKKGKKAEFRSNLQEEFQKALDFDEDMNESDQIIGRGNEVNPAELFKNGAQMITESSLLGKSNSDSKLSKFLESIPPSSAAFITLSKLNQIQVSLFSNMWQCWTTSLVLPKLFDNCSPELLKKLHLTSLIDLDSILSHLRNIVPTWLRQLSSPASQTIPLSSVKVFQGIVLLCCVGIHNHLRVRPSLADLIQKQLHSLPFVIMDDGDCMLASNLVMDLDTDLTTQLRVVPSYLQDLGYLLNLIGAAGIANIPRPVVKVTNPLVHQDLLLSKILLSFNKKELSDVEFRVTDSSQQSKYRSIYAHKLILGLNCPFFYAMFTSGMKETESSICIIQVEEDVGYEATLLFLHYLYTGNLDKPEIKLHPYSQESVATALGLLRLSDKYFVDYIKQWCEVYLSDRQVITIQNICELYHIAFLCNASQLMNTCIYEISSILHVIVETNEWKQLPPSIRESLLSSIKTQKK